MCWCTISVFPLSRGEQKQKGRGHYRKPCVVAHHMETVEGSDVIHHAYSFIGMHRLVVPVLLEKCMYCSSVNSIWLQPYVVSRDCVPLQVNPGKY